MRSSYNNNKLRQIDEEKRRIALRITELQSEIDRVNEQIKSLIPQITSSEDDAFAQIRRLQRVREIMAEQLEQMHEVLRNGG